MPRRGEGFRFFNMGRIRRADKGQVGVHFAMREIRPQEQMLARLHA
ncbi:Hypothetical Protein RSKD131_0503 [Cereibacter sphaeroides KD131]|nr:Hypothetical Protein RSKD131_0503 [Cereibacter sphaeroides KD131]